MSQAILTAFARHDGEVLLCRQGSSAAVAPGRWTGVTVRFDPADDPATVAPGILRDRTGVTPVEVVRSGGPVDHGGGGPSLKGYAVLVDVEDRALDPVDEIDATAWDAPSAILDRPRLSGVWRAYDAVAPSVRSIGADTVNGSSYLSLRALEVLRDRAAVLANGGGSGDELAELARELRSVRPEMTALKVRVARVIAEGTDPAAVVDRAHRAVREAATARREAALAAAEALGSGSAVFTFSRSATVRDAIEHAEPARVITTVAEPGGEGIRTAEELVEGRPVELYPDAAVASAVADADFVLVGADAVGAGATVRNKVGTRTVAAVADRLDVPVYVVTTTAKLCATEAPIEHVPRGSIYDGDAPISVHGRRFDHTRAIRITAYFTERGRLDPATVDDVATANADLLETT